MKNAFFFAASSGLAKAEAISSFQKKTYFLQYTTFFAEKQDKNNVFAVFFHPFPPFFDKFFRSALPFNSKSPFPFAAY